MKTGSVLLDPVAALLAGPSRDALRIALVVPQSGVLGLTGPAALAAATLAAEQVNHSEVLRERRISLVPIDAGQPIQRLTEQVRGLVAGEAVDALCGFHTSDVHRHLEQITAGRVPYLFTPPHEGGPRLPGVALLGADPEAQLLPAMRQLASRPELRRWALVGSDYIWPRSVRAAAQRMLPSYGARIVADELVPIARVDAERLVDVLRQSRAQVVLLSLVGRDLATFNRGFAESNLLGKVVRVSGALDETGLLEIDGDDTGELYSSMEWFATDPETERFREQYAARWGAAAPPLGDYAHGCYEGIGVLADLAAADRLTVADVAEGVAAARRQRSRLARAEGLDLRVVR